MSSQSNLIGQDDSSTADDPFRYRSDSDESPSEAVIAAVAKIAGKRPAASNPGSTTDTPAVLAPLYSVIDPDALDTLVQGSDDGTVSFSYEGYSITVEDEDTVVAERTT